MRRGKKLLLMLLVLAVLLTAAYTATKITETVDAEDEAPAAVVFSVEPSEVTNLTWTYQGEELSFDYDGENWTYALDASFPTAPLALNTMLDTIASVTASKTIEAVEDWDQYGLEEPLVTITVTAGETYTLSVGAQTSLDSLRYFSTGDGNAYLVDESLYENFLYGLYDLVQCEEIPQLEVTAMTIRTADQTLEIRNIPDSGLAYSNEYEWFLDDGSEYRTLDNELTEDLIASVTGLSWNSCVNYAADHEALAEYGLEEPAATVTLENSNGETFTLELGNTTSSGCYARIAGSGMVYLVDADLGETFAFTTYADLQPDEVLLMDWDMVDSVDITLDDTVYTLTRLIREVTDDEGSTSQEIVYQLDSQDIDIGDALESLTDLSSTGYANGAQPQRSPEISFTFHRSDAAYPEVRLVFYQYNADSCLVQLNGESTVFTSRSKLVALTEEITQALLGA